MSARLKTIPLSKLQRAQANVRKTGRDADVKALAASIEAHGLLQNLTVRPVATNGKSDDRYEVIAGGRRLAALRKLAKSKRIAKDFPVPCSVLADSERPEELSLAENVERLPLHAADQFDAFYRLHHEGLAAGEIAARFGIAERLVLQRLKLAAVSPKLVDVYRNDGMTLEQLMAFTVSGDPEAQERAWFENPYGHASPAAIRRALTAAMVEFHDRRVRFVGVAAYEAAGGEVVRDLFSEDGDGYLADSTLLDRLVSEKLTKEAKAILAEGWSWIETLPDVDYGMLARYGRVSPTDGLSDQEKSRLSELCDRYDGLVETLDEDPSTEHSATLDALETEIEALSKKREQWSDADKATAGAIVSVGHDGGLHVVRGLVKPEARNSEANGGEREKSANGSARPKDGISDALRENLSAHRTAALRAELVDRPEAAFSVLLYTLVVQLFFGGEETCLKVTLNPTDISTYEGVGDSRAVQVLAERQRAWTERLPVKEGLWHWLLRLEDEDESSLLAVCVAMVLDAVRRKHDREDAARFADADRVATALGLDMSQWWQPTRDGYFDHVSKEQILAAVAEAKSSNAAENIAKLKKPAMAAKAEALVNATGWLPAQFRAGQP